jgi:translation machinery-associated protein 16
MKALQSRKSNVTGHKLHPNSRRAKQLQRVELRTKKLNLQGKVQRTTEIKRGGSSWRLPSQSPPLRKS